MISAAALADLNEFPYELRSVTPAEPPPGDDGTWYRYEIAQGASLIVGLRCGTESEVDFFLRDTIGRLNERRMGKNRSRVKPARPVESPATAQARS